MVAGCAAQLGHWHVVAAGAQPEPVPGVKQAPKPGGLPLRAQCWRQELAAQQLGCWQVQVQAPPVGARRALLRTRAPVPA